MLKNNKAITLIALIITIIVLLILATVTLNMLLGENGLINKTKASVEKYKEMAIKEKAQIAIIEVKIQMINQKETRTMSEYIKSFTDGVELEEGLVYEKNNQYFFIDNENNVVELSNIDGNLQVEKVIGKNDEIGRKTVTYNLNGGTGTLPKNILKKSGTIVEVYFEITPTREGYRFIGYSDTQNGEAIYTAGGDTSFTMPNNDVTLYAVWKAEKRIVFNSSYDTSSYTVTGGEVAVNNANGIYPTSYPSGNNWRFTTVSIDNDEISVGPKFEITMNAFFNNNSASSEGLIQIILLNSNTNSSTYVWIRDPQVSNITTSPYFIYNNQSVFSAPNYDGYTECGTAIDGNLKIIGDGTKISAYIGNTLLNQIDCSDGFSFDKIQIDFGAHKTNPIISMGVREIYIHELE